MMTIYFFFKSHSKIIFTLISLKNLIDLLKRLTAFELYRIDRLIRRIDKMIKRITYWGIVKIDLKNCTEIKQVKNKLWKIDKLL